VEKPTESGKRRRRSNGIQNQFRGRLEFEQRDLGGGFFRNVEEIKTRFD